MLYRQKLSVYSMRQGAVICKSKGRDPDRNSLHMYLGRVSDILGTRGQVVASRRVAPCVAIHRCQLSAQLDKLLRSQQVSRQVVLDMVFKPASSQNTSLLIWHFMLTHTIRAQ